MVCLLLMLTEIIIILISPLDQSEAFLSWHYHTATPSWVQASPEGRIFRFIDP